MWWIPVAMAAASMLHEKDKTDRARSAQAPIDQAKAKWSGWTGMQPGNAVIGDPLGAGMQGFGAGMAMKQGMENQDAYNRWLNRQTTDSSGNMGSWSMVGNGSQYSNMG